MTSTSKVCAGAAQIQHLLAGLPVCVPGQCNSLHALAQALHNRCVRCICLQREYLALLTRLDLNVQV